MPSLRGTASVEVEPRGCWRFVEDHHALRYVRRGDSYIPDAHRAQCVGGGIVKPPPTQRQVRDALRQLAAIAPDQEKALAANLALGLNKPEKQRAAPVRRPGATESEVLSAVLAFLRRHPAVAWAERMQVGAYETDERYIRYGFVGLSDIVGQMKTTGAFLAVECKRERGSRVSPAQQAFIDRVRKHGGVAGVVTSVDEAVLLIKYAQR